MAVKGLTGALILSPAFPYSDRVEMPSTTGFIMGESLDDISSTSRQLFEVTLLPSIAVSAQYFILSQANIDFILVLAILLNTAIGSIAAVIGWAARAGGNNE